MKMFSIRQGCAFIAHVLQSWGARVAGELDWELEDRVTQGWKQEDGKTWSNHEYICNIAGSTTSSYPEHKKLSGVKLIFRQTLETSWISIPGLSLWPLRLAAG